MLNWKRGKQVHLIGAGSTGQDNPATTSVTAHFGHIHADDAYFAQGFLDIVETVFPDDGFDFLGHGSLSGVSLLPMLADIKANFFFVSGNTQAHGFRK